MGGERIIYVPPQLAFARRASKNWPDGIDENSSVVIRKLPGPALVIA